ncbi:MAG: SpoIIE family protein phosphatase [Candidatus Acidiferrum sp.]
MSTMEGKKQLLVVDDEPANIRLISSILTDEYNIRSATNGADALGRALSEPMPDLILLDVMMPRMDGYEVCRKLKSAPKTREIPVIFLTGQTKDEDETQGFEVGAVDYIHKPFSAAVVTARVRTHIQLCEARQLLARQLMAINNELEMAREIQLSILPSDTPKIEGLDIAARYIPMTSVAGDFYDFIRAGELQLGILIADVSGHGLPAALIASMLKVALPTQTPNASNPARVLTGLNRSLYGKFRRHFVTAAYLFVDLKKHIVSYAGAGHPPLLFWRKREGKAREVQENGLILGPFAEATYSSIQLPIEVGDRLLLYTDGALEFRSPVGEEFGGARLRQFIETNQDLSADQLVDTLISELWRWAEQAPGTVQKDDITLLAIDFKGH